MFFQRFSDASDLRNEKKSKNYLSWIMKATVYWGETENYEKVQTAALAPKFFDI